MEELSIILFKIKFKCVLMGGERGVMSLAKPVFDISSVALILAIFPITADASLKFKMMRSPLNISQPLCC